MTRCRGTETRIVEVTVDRRDLLRGLKTEIFGLLSIPETAFYNERGILVTTIQKDRSHAQEDIDMPVSVRLCAEEARAVRAILELESAIPEMFKDRNRDRDAKHRALERRIDEHRILDEDRVPAYISNEKDC